MGTKRWNNMKSKKPSVEEAKQHLQQMVDKASTLWHEQNQTVLALEALLEDARAKEEKLYVKYSQLQNLQNIISD